METVVRQGELGPARVEAQTPTALQGTRPLFQAHRGLDRGESQADGHLRFPKQPNLYAATETRLVGATIRGLDGRETKSKCGLSFATGSYHRA